MLTAAGADGADGGYVTLAFNNNEEFCQGNPVSLQVIKVNCAEPYRGELKVIEPENVLDEAVTFIHTGDFAGEPEKLIFEWRYEISVSKPNLPNDTDKWTNYEPPTIGKNSHTIEGEGVQVLQDKWITCRYSYARPNNSTVNSIC